jgi:aminopeptidase YwaD
MKRLLKTIPAIFLLLLFVQASNAQKMSAAEKKYFTLLRKNFNAQNCYQTTGYVEQRWRLAGNTGFDESIFYVEKILQQAGFVKETNGETDHTLTYRIEKRPMGHATWEPIDAQLFIQGQDMPLLEFKTNRNMMAMYSASTPAEGVTAELVYVGNGSDKDVADKQVAGKIIMGEGSIGKMYAIAMKNGALGALAYSIPAYNQPEKYTNSISFQGIQYKAADSLQQKWGILLSYAAKEKLQAALAKGPVFVKVITRSKIYTSEELTLVANVQGTEKPAERFVYSAHVQEPGASDNATGVGTLAEMARVTALLVQQKQIIPKRTITFLWGDEIISTGRYIHDDSVRAKGIKWGLSLDMVGEDVTKTSGSFLIEKMPDPSAIWTRGKDKHTEWGGSVLDESALFPHYFNDLLLTRCLNEAAATGWVVNTNPFEGGSDHTPFLEAKIPGLLMWHFTDVFYHTDADRLDKVSAEEMRHVGISGLVTAYMLTDPSKETAIAITQEITRSALQRLKTEFALSKEITTKGGDKAKEQHILEVWTNWYVQAIEKTSDILVGAATPAVQNAINASTKKLQQQALAYYKQL